MADGRKNNGGHSTNGGRPPKADELKKIEMMDSIAAPKSAWQKVWDLCVKEDTQALRMWIEHRFGKPKERVDMTSGDEPLQNYIDVSKLKPEEIRILLKAYGRDSKDTD